MNIYESAEDYLEQILVLLEEKGYARSTDIAESLGVDEEIARKDACKIEHDISEESFNAIRSSLK